MLKAEEEERSHLKADKDTRLAEESSHKAEEHERAQLNIE